MRRGHEFFPHLKSEMWGTLNSYLKSEMLGTRSLGFGQQLKSSRELDQ